MTPGQPYLPRGAERLHSAFSPPKNWRSELKIWWREVDRVLLGLIGLLMVCGLFAVAAGSPASAARLSTADVTLSPLRFFWMHAAFLALGVGVMLGISMLPQKTVRQGGILLGAVMIVLLLLVPIIGSEVNGAKRWINLGIRFQPSEFLKPAFAIMLAWILSWRLRDPTMPVMALAGILTGLVALLLMLQPNFGDAVLFAAVFVIAVFLSGLPLQLLAWLGGFGLLLVSAAYIFYDNARHRIDSFLGGGTAFDQVDLAERALLGGGWTGTGMRLGTEKMRLPEAHTDYVFSVIGEEFGLVACAVIVVLFLAIILRVLSRLMDEENLFTILAATGLTALFGGQAFINILVNLQLFPSKGMTLPLVSYGGSSTVAICLTLGALLAITRRNPFLQRERFDWRALLPKGRAR